MASFFNLTDIVFNKGNKQRSGSVADTLAGSDYEHYTHRYPSDIGSYDKGHYIIFHINTQEKSEFSVAPEVGVSPTIVKNRLKMEQITGAPTNLGGYGDKLSSEIGGLLSKVSDAASAIKSGISDVVNKSEVATKAIASAPGQAIAGGIEGAGQAFTSALSNLKQGSFLRATKRTAQTIVLYMPDTMTFDYQQDYSSLNLGESKLTMAAAAGVSAVDTLNSGGSYREIGRDFAKNASPFLLKLAGDAIGGDVGKALFAATSGMVVNPQLEVLYSSPKFRAFRFDFVLYPRSQEEAREVLSIVNTFKFHQAPEIAKNTGAYFLIPPSEFDIEFHCNGEENINIPKISTCVMTNMQVDYGDVGQWATYEVPNQRMKAGGTGMPVGIRLSVEFQETEIHTKASYDTRPDGVNY